MMRKEKEIVKNFYNNFGWLKNTNGTYKDTFINVDMRPILDFYHKKICTRVKNCFSLSGRYFLDAGSGANPAYQYSAGYQCHVCIDLSKRGFLEAKSKLQKGVYVLADITKLPFRDNIFDAIFAAHVLYHVPKDEQEYAVREFHRVLKSGGAVALSFIHAGTARLTLCSLRHRDYLKKL